ncbi:MFS transporter [Variovorax sp. J22R24]|uniref:MFS transporter n=1 Tax=Variovorax gracilis TaxID=3053502 RepID=UPI0025755FD6|nr:MFS transporter [Variovorax sp. J22R24]MDM0108162.1 MFS transporter [Variovorax sp. J22R24]
MNTRSLASQPAEKSALEKATMRRVALRILPFLMLCYFIAYVDRVNAGFAALQMNKDLGLSQAMFGLGGSLFFIAYILFEIPSNLALQKFGARLWIARIMVTWGVIGALAAFAVGPYSYYLGRFLLGAAEAGFFPGVILYLTYWFPKEYRGRIVATFMVAIPISSLLGSPISAALLGTDGWLGLRGWQWLFILEAIPAVVLGVMVFFILPNRPDNAKWLTGEQRDWLNARLESEKQEAKPVAHMSVMQILKNKYVLALAVVYAGSSATSNALSLWQPQILKSLGLTTMETGLMNGIPFAVASVIMVLWGRRADRSGERIWNTALPLALTSACLVATQLTAGSLAATMVLLTFVLVGTYSIKGPFWALSTEWLSAGSAAAGIAAINTLAHIGTSGATWMLGAIKDATGSYPLALLPLALLTGLGAAIVVWMGRSQARDAVALDAPTPPAASARTA